MGHTLTKRGEMSVLESLIFILMFVLPFPITCVSPPEKSIQIQYFFMTGYLALFIIKPNYLLKTLSGTSLCIVLIYIIGALVKYLVYEHLTVTSIILPIVAFYGYYYLEDKHIKLRVFDYLLLLLYVFFILTYFSKLPSLFMRVQFDDGSWYGSSSSNAISIILINVLYIYEVLAYLQKDNRRWILFTFALINLFLVIAQQSRAGILISLLFVIWNLFQIRKTSKSKIVRMSPWFLLIVVFYLIVNNQELISEYVDVVGDMSVSSYENDGRNRSVQAYFDNMDLKVFLVGYPLDSMSYDGNSYTFNTFLDHWNKYTIIGFLLTIFLFLNRVLKQKRYFFPLVFLVPFFLYGWVEPRYLPNYWDFFIYLMLFKKCESPQLTETSSKNLPDM